MTGLVVRLLRCKNDCIARVAEPDTGFAECGRVLMLNNFTGVQVADWTRIILLAPALADRLGSCSLRRLKRLLLVLSIAVSGAILPPASMQVIRHPPYFFTKVGLHFFFATQHLKPGFVGLTKKLFTYLLSSADGSPNP